MLPIWIKQSKKLFVHRVLIGFLVILALRESIGGRTSGLWGLEIPSSPVQTGIPRKTTFVSWLYLSCISLKSHGAFSIPLRPRSKEASEIQS